MWLAIVVAFALCVAAYWMLEPALEFSLPELSYRDGICAVQFDATNHTDNRLDAVLRIVVGRSNRFGKGKFPTYTDMAQKAVSASFMAREKKTVVCEISMPSFSLGGSDARIEVESIVQSAR